MPKNKDSGLRVFVVTFVVCVVCSLVVSFAAIYLQPKQDYNKEINKKKNILLATKYFNTTDLSTVDQLYHSTIVEKNVDLSSGVFLTSEDKATEQLIHLDAKDDIAGVKRISNVAAVYFVKNLRESDLAATWNQKFSRVILPVYGKGLWSTIYGLVTLNSDLTTVEGLSFYEHGETPGLGDAIESLAWQQKWVGKKPFDEFMNPIIKIIKRGEANEHQVDGISGATLTSLGVEHTLNFWLGELGYGVFLKNLKNGKLEL